MASQTDLSSVLDAHRELMGDHGFQAASTFMESLTRLRTHLDGAGWEKLEERFEMAEPGSREATDALAQAFRDAGIHAYDAADAGFPFSNLEMMSALRAFDDLAPQALDAQTATDISNAIEDTGNVIAVGDMVPPEFIDIARECIHALGYEERFYLLDRTIGRVDDLDPMVWDEAVHQAVFIRINDAATLVSDHHPNWRRIYEDGRVLAVLQMPRPKKRDDMPLVLVLLGGSGRTQGDVLAVTLEDLEGDAAAANATDIIKAALCSSVPYRNDEGHHCIIPASMIEKNHGNVLPDLYLHNAELFEWQRARNFKRDIQKTAATFKELRENSKPLDDTIFAATGMDARDRVLEGSGGTR